MANKKHKVVTEPYKYKSGTIRPRGGAFQAEICQFGKRYRSTLKTAENAETWIDATEGDLRKFGVSAAILSPTQRRDALDALQLLAEARRNVTLTAAVRSYLKSNAVTCESITVKMLFDIFLESKSEDTAAVTIKTDYAKTGLFVSSFADRGIADIQEDDIKDWLQKNMTAKNWSKKNYNKYLSAIRQLFRFAGQPNKGNLKNNPAQFIDTKKLTKEKIKRYTVEECRKIMNLTAKESPHMVPAIALCLFGGLRPESEVARLDWEDISLEKKKINISAERTKTSTERDRDIDPVLAEWLKPFAKKSGKIMISERQYQAHAKLMNRHKISKIYDAFRHTSATMHCAFFGDSAKTAKQMGHSVQMLVDHYMDNATKDEAAKFWSLSPTADDLKAIAAFLHPAKRKLLPITSSEFFGKWLKVQARDLEKASFAKYKGVADCFLTYLSGDGFKPMHKLPADCIEKFKAYILEQEKSAGTVAGYGKILNKAFADAVRWDHLPEENKA